MKYAVILFDADGVLIKSQYLFSERLEAEYGIPRESVSPFFSGVFQACSMGKADLKVELAKVIKEWGWKGTVDELLQFWFTKGTVIDQDVAAFVREIRRSGIRTYLTTDQEKYRGEHLRKTLVTDGKLFEDVFFSAEIGCSKKDPAFFDHVARAIGDVPRNQVLFVDDDKNNVEVAMGCGFDGFHFTNLAELKLRLTE